jgi:hypothetical protein
MSTVGRVAASPSIGVLQEVPLKQQERPNFDIVGRRELKVRIWNRKVGRNGDV